jgi:DNA primase
MFLDFAALKESADIAHIASLLQITLNKQGEQLRGPCPHCKEGGDRALVITPSKKSWYCFAGMEGGDVIALVAHVHGWRMKQAAMWLDEVLKQNPTQEKMREKGKLLPLNHLAYEHEAVQAMGVPKDYAASVGIGYARKGVLRGHVAIPIRDAEGTLLIYVGYNPADHTWKWGGTF